MSKNFPGQLRILVVIMWILSSVIPAHSVLGGEQTGENGFYGIRWGAKLADVEGLTLVESTGRIQTYQLKDGSSHIDNINIDKMQFVAIEGLFARASLHYSGKDTHTHILEYLQSQYGPVERAPGSMMRGMSQQFTWRKEETEVNLTYQSFEERGTIFIESRTLAPRFNDVLPESAF